MVNCPKRKKLCSGKSLTTTTTKRVRNTKAFTNAVKEKVGLDICQVNLTDGGRPRSTCTHCQKTIVNIMARWQSHVKTCSGLRHRKEADILRHACTRGSESHRQETCDQMSTVYWTYCHKMSFTTALKCKEVDPLFVYYCIRLLFVNSYSSIPSPFTTQLLLSLHCVNKTAAKRLHLSRTTVARYIIFPLCRTNCGYKLFCYDDQQYIPSHPHHPS